VYLAHRLFLIIGISLFVLFVSHQSTDHSTVVDLPQVLSISSPQSFPESRQIPPPEITAKSVFAMTYPDKVVLYSKNSKDRLHPASLTKIVTALAARSIYSEDQILTVFNAAGSTGMSVELAVNDQISFLDLLHAILIPSGNDSAVTLAENYSDGGYTGFVQTMNHYLARHGMSDTHLANVSGLTARDHYSSAYDMAKLGHLLLQDNLLADIVSRESYSFTSHLGRDYSFRSTNRLISKQAIGIKTGWTEDAGECLVTAFPVGDTTVIISMMGSKDRFGETLQVLQYIKDNYYPL
jgi:serine-type D-Ala-D-Ala carboxypeptidase (penicillin-binding protein 5/6)